ncbi:MAG: hypothetical protein COZ34_04745 [Candidatus Pacebacteria bacterium CG_4_10_14_3_um_filter_34_15]|nr:hypothetical protein [Candidatus Pacearchaeota archaeon]NCQ65501.1 hypothetical protein [Candidatus Paceibacterota bacterium]OIO45382.1 MAG: hypothetical protein AUJ41_00085 [Candidatus Pacebacteria bacterium CG1_02_43_31]PIQ80646.1 MAG: hypothetical protein COV78_04540 [Candidatus Pacebacteria bacterium CG11_big_fil_rev_8_21_14_0_20_34_55]PIX81157.1 MAG: hypothetical protein COZ34_04745 [Candidatus Pacebacteria bacterium CG_4_10_14_3_um_filter_34_15]PJC43998.1 MAG: hypothetical protein CO0
MKKSSFFTNFFWTCLIFPMFVSIFYVLFIANLINLLNWRWIVISRIIFAVAYAVGIIFLTIRYRHNSKNLTLSFKLKIKNMIGYLALFMFFFFLSPVTAYKDLLTGPIEYVGNCETKNKFTTVSVEHFLVITNPNLSLKIGGKYYNFLSTEFYGGKCVQAVAIKYLPYSKIVIDLDEINEP